MMVTEKKKHTRSSLNLRLIAGLYLLYIDYSLISGWKDIERGSKVMVVIAAVIFAAFAGLIIYSSLKGLKEMKEAIPDYVEIDDVQEIEEIKKTD